MYIHHTHCFCTIAKLTIFKAKYNLVQNGKLLTGKRTENDSTTFDIEGTLVHNALYFVKGQTRRSDRYKRRRHWKLQQGQLQAVLLNNELYLTCKLREYSPDIMEPGQPISLQFAKSKHLTGKIDSIGRPDLTPQVVSHTAEQPRLNLTLHATTEAGISLTPYPNPFSGQLTVAYSIPINGKVTMALYDMQGRQGANMLNSYFLKLSAKYLFKTFQNQLLVSFANSRAFLFFF